MKIFFRQFVVCVLLCSGAAAVTVGGGDDALPGDTDWPMDLDPVLEGPAIERVWDRRQVEIWKQLLMRPRADDRRRAADEVGLAHLDGRPDMAQFGPVLKRQLAIEKHPVVRLAVAGALIRLDARDAAGLLLEANRRDGQAMVLLTDAALAAWGYQSAAQLWAARLDAMGGSRAVVMSAIKSLGVMGAGRLGSSGAGATLRVLVFDESRDKALRLAAGNALGQITRQGLIGSAMKLASGSPFERLLASRLIAFDDSDQAKTIETKLAIDDDPVVASAALRYVLRTEPALIRDHVSRLLTSDDSGVRLLTSQCVQTYHDEASIKWLSLLLNDANPDIRRGVRVYLIQSDAQLADVVRREATGVLDGDQWAGLEQATMVLGAVDHEPAADRLVELLMYPRGEVRVAAAVALRRLAVQRVLPDMLKYATATAAWSKQRPAATKAAKAKGVAQKIDPIGRGLALTTVGDQLAQLYQAFGQMRFGEADSLMMTHVPKGAAYPDKARGGAVWALGLLHEGESGHKLAGQLRGRLADAFGMFPESTTVRSMAAVSLGRMKAKSAVGSLRNFYKREPIKSIGGACRWAITQISDIDPGPLPPQRQVESNYFVTPMGEF